LGISETGAAFSFLFVHLLFSFANIPLLNLQSVDISLTAPIATLLKIFACLVEIKTANDEEQSEIMKFYVVIAASHFAT
jgi:hypothetical protein